jgi:DNA-binding transcriptional regulator YhcF (GntR family)
MDQSLAAFDLAVDRDDDLPLATQLAWKLKALIAAGHLRPGARLPGVRDLAELAGVNTNTVRAVYTRLDQQGLIRSEHGRGTFVAEDSEAAELGRLAAAAAAQAERAGLDRRELAAALYGASKLALPAPRAPERPPGRSPDEERRLRRRLRREISSLEGDLSALEPLTPGRARPADAAAGRLLSAAELERVRDELRHRVDELRHEQDSARGAYREAQAEEEDRRREEALREAQSRVWPHAGASTGRRRTGGVRVAWTMPRGW